MAEPISREALQQLPRQDYSALRGVLRTGDLLFACGDYPISRLIRRLTGSPWSHCGVVFRLAEIDRILILESVEGVGVRFAPLSKYTHDFWRGRPYRGRVVLARVEGADAVAVRLGQFGTHQLTRPYDWWEMLRVLYRLLFGRVRRHRDRAYVCSELVYECFREAGIKLSTDARGFVSPENLWRDARVSLLARIV